MVAIQGIYLYIRGVGVGEFEFPIEEITIFVKSIKKGIKWNAHCIPKSIIGTAKNLPENETSSNESRVKNIL
jgi:hypothetical protein